MRRALAVSVVTVVLMFARAGNAQQREPLYTPSIFIYGFNGFFLGAGAGLGAGYIAGRAGGWHQDDWRAVAYGTGIGALVGGALGVSLGITDMVNESPGRGYFILRDGGYGLGFGAVTGAIAGALAAIGTKHAENIAFGAAIGGLVGTGLGVVLGVVEGNKAWRRRTGVAMNITVAPAASTSGGLVWVPALVGRY